MEITPYLSFDGTCAEAFRFYERILGGRIVVLQTFGESPMAKESPADWQDRVLHARLEVNGATLLGSDAPPGTPPPSGMCVSISVEKPEDAERIFSTLAEGGQVYMPMGETFWAARFGMCNDRFGIPWMINCNLLE